MVIASTLALDFYPIKLSRRSSEVIVRDLPELLVPPTAAVASKRVLLVDDICVTGTTLRMAREAIAQQGAAEVREAILAIHERSVLPDWYALKTDALLLFPWDRDEYVEDGWRINAEYQKQIDEMGPGRPLTEIAT